MKWYSKYLPVYEKPFAEVPAETVAEVRAKLAERQSDRPLATVSVIACNEEKRLTACLWSLAEQRCRYPMDVEIEKFEIEGNLRRIYAAVLVDKPGQKAILIGRDGERMKKIATEARTDMEKLFDSKVFLEVWVKVKSGWADDVRFLKQFNLD
jgi:GTP-binding protein Era